MGRALRLVWNIAPLWSLINVALVIVQGILPLAALYLMKRILDAVSSVVASHSPDAFQSVVFWILLAGAAALLAVLASAISDYVTEAQSLQVTDSVANILHAQSVAMDLAYYENPSYYDTLHRAQREAPYRPTRIVNGLVQVAQNGISLLCIAGLLVSFNWLLTVLLLLAALPSAIVRLMYSRLLFGYDQAQTEKERQAWFYHNVLTDVVFAKEVRLLNLGTLFQNRFRDLHQDIRTGKLSLSSRRVRADLLAQFLATVILFGSLAWIARQALLGTITLSDLIIYFLAFQSGLSFLQSLLHSLAGLYEDNLFLTNLYRFLDLKPQITAPSRPSPVPQPMRQGVTFHNIGFTYPSRDQETLHDINLTLAPNEVIALVGENGSGKTTLVKLLCRLYDPTRGEITVDGTNLRFFDPVQWRRELGVIFQDYAHYALTVRENIWIGNVDAPPDMEGIAEAGRISGADEVVRHLPQAYDTMLGSWFNNGQELSGGEWQKIALARTFWRKARLLILDEPTSGLDPLAEAELFRQFRALLNGHSAILISHRFSTVQMADCIYVMEQGRIVEHGSHSALLAQNGRYAHLFHTQAQYYQDSN